MNAVTITLPCPPLPLSQCFINVGRSRTSSPSYKVWKRDCDNHLMAFHNYARGKNGKPAIPGRVKVDIFDPPAPRQTRSRPRQLPKGDV